MECFYCKKPLQESELKTHASVCPVMSQEGFPHKNTCPLCGDTGEVFTHYEKRDWGDTYVDEPCYDPCLCELGILCGWMEVSCPRCGNENVFFDSQKYRAENSGWICPVCGDIEKPTWPRPYESFEAWLRSKNHISKTSKFDIDKDLL